MKSTNSAASGMWFPCEGTNRLDVPDELRREGVFLPRPLPSDVILGSRIHRELARAEQALGRLDEAVNRLPGNAALVRSTQVREIQSSLGLDDVNTALREVLLADLPGQRSTAMITPIVARYRNASDAAFKAVAADEPLDSERWIRIASLFDDSATERGGDDPDVGGRVWRDQPGWLGGHTISDAYLLTSPTSADIQAALAQLVTWTGADCPLPLVGKLALGHYQFTVLQPFQLGNGHLARLYIGLELARAEVLRGQILPISMWLDRHRDQHQAQIRRVVDTGDFTEWVAFFADAIREVCLNQVQLVCELESARDNLLDQLARRGSSLNTGSIRRVVAGLVATPITNHNQIAARHKLSAKSATEITRRLVMAGVAENMDNKTYGKVFVIPAYMHLLTLNDPPPPTSDGDAFDGPTHRQPVT
jgi:Fic family protein